MFDWERIWRGNGIQYAVLAIIGFALYGRPPKSERHLRTSSRTTTIIAPGS
jgi:hypothetical protein